MSKIANKDLARFLVEKYDIDRAAAEQLVTHFFEVVNDGLRDEKQVKVKGLGTFKVTSVASRKSVDVNTGEPIIIEGRDKISFTADAAMRDQVNRPFAQFETVVVNEGVEFDEIDRKFADSMVESDDDGDGDTGLDGDNDTANVSGVTPAATVEPLPENSVRDVPEVASEPKTVSHEVSEQLVIDADLLARLNADRPKEAVAPGADMADEHPAADDAGESDAVTTDNRDVMTMGAGPAGEVREDRLVLDANQLAWLNGRRPVAGKSEPQAREQSEEMGMAPLDQTAETSAPGDEAPSQDENALSREEEAPTRMEESPTAGAENTHSSEVEVPAVGEGNETDDGSGLGTIRLHTLELAEQVERQHRMLKVVIGVAALLVVGCIGAMVWMMGQLDKKNNRIQHLEAQTVPVKTAVAPVIKSQPEPDTLAMAKAKADSVAAIRQRQELEKAEQAKAAALAEAELKEKRRIEEEAVKAAEARKAAPAKQQETAVKADRKPAAESHAAARQSAYNNDVRVRTGAYTITGIDHTVTVRPGQTLSSISKANLGPGMECYIEAVNGGRTEFKAGEKVKIPALKLKKR